MMYVALAGAMMAGLSAADARTNTMAPMPMQQAGTLTCTIEPGIGLIIGSSRAASCTFDHPGARYFSESYSARLSRIGIDLGIMSKQSIKWSVFTPGGEAHPGMLSGIHSGSSSEAAIVAGPGAQIGFANDGGPIVLQQLSGTIETGLSLGLGQTTLELVSITGSAVIALK
jgi:hypothetical protein